MPGATITVNYLDVMGVQPALGRNLTGAEDTPGGPAAVLVGDTLWRQRFGANPGVPGQQLILDGMSREIVGVLPPTVDYPRRAQVLVPLGDLRKDRDYLDRDEHNGFRTLGRLKPGVAQAQAREDLNNIAADPVRRDGERPPDACGRPMRARRRGVAGVLAARLPRDQSRSDDRSTQRMNDRLGAGE